MHIPVVRRVGAVAAPVLLVASVSACTAEEAEPIARQTAPNGIVFNAADAEFANDLLLQRAEEFVLIDLTVERALSPELEPIVNAARDARATEVDQVTTWLTDWGKEVPVTMRDHSSGHGESHHFPEIEKASDAEFESVWINAYLAELADSDTIVQDEQEQGLYAEAVQLAESAEAVNDDESDALEDLAN